MTSERTWTIAELADELGVTHRTLRHYEQLGLLSPERRGPQRVYRRGDRVRLELILRGRRLGFGLAEIGRIIGMYDEQPGEVGQLRYLLQRVAEQRAQLQQRRHDIDAALAELVEVERRCLADLRQLAGEPAARQPGQERDR
ncbi:MerR family transcriptional regulator [Ornithinicoccus halotolerans]|uniref:MerR family transcriptional regulator n=1 Tax=Ornithinicoccus halotolerans TaxID=1748220 RepID=UPI001296A935|nr:MerR family DNA-binding transcriptional regulator [Ornithinicoccus halotolerans]